ncbi:MAG: glutathione S-transferase [Chamaesiphon sp.]|nr:glutathione S-transferase [Chamaesiphon sp.]
MITVHHLNNSRSQRILWLLEELGLDYDIKYYQRDPETMLAPASLRQVHPLGKAPVITDDSLTLAESGAIIEYLVERYGEGRFAPPLDVPERLRYRYWLHYAEGSLMPPLLIKLVFDQMEQRSPFFLRPIVRLISQPVRNSFIDPQITTHLDYLEAELKHSDWFAGDQFTAADIQMSFPLESATEQAGLDASRPKLMDWLDRIHARPAYQRAVKRGAEVESKQ